MSGFFSRIFGGKKKSEASGVEGLIEKTLETLIEKGGFDLTFDVKAEADDEGQVIHVEISGADDELMKDREGQMIDAIELFLQRVVQHNFAQDKTKIVIDCGGYREESSHALTELADKLKEMALEKGRSVYFRALPPKDRKIIHQHLAADDRIKSRSIGEGNFKKIKIYPAKNSKENSDNNISE